MKITQPRTEENFRQLVSSVNAGGVIVIDAGGYYVGTTLEEILAEIGAGTAPGAYLTVIGGGKGTVQALGTLGATETIDLANGNKFWGTLDQACTLDTTGWTTGKDCQISVELIQDGTGGWTPTFTGVTWIGGTPDWDTDPGTVTHVVLFSRDGGTTIYGAVVGGGGNFPGVVVAHGAMGATETLDYEAGTYHQGTLNANCVVDFTGLISGKDCGITFEVTEDGTGGHTLGFTGVTWLGGVTPTHDDTAGVTEFYGFFSPDGGTTIIGGQLGGGASLTVEDEGTPLATAATTLDFVGAGVVATGAGTEKTITISGAPAGAAGGDLSGTYPNPSVIDDSHSHTDATLPTGFVGAILISDTPSTPLVFADLIQNEAQDDLVYADV